MTASEIIELAENELPSVSDIEQDRYRVPIQNKHQFDVDILMLQTDAPTIYDRPFYVVEFRKQYISGIAIGWEFVEIVNGI